MGVSTFAVGLLPSYATIGVAAPVILIALRLLQGLALGGEYGGAATYVVEHAPPDKRGLFTSWIQTTPTLGLFVSLVVIVTTREVVGADFDGWGWRIPFAFSLLLLAISISIRLQLQASPVVHRMNVEGSLPRAPITESFLRWGNLKSIVLVLLGGVAGQAVVWYTSMFYGLFFLNETLKVPSKDAGIMVALSLALATPFFIFFGWLSDRVGRKRVIMFGCVIAALTYVPIFRHLTKSANPAMFDAQDRNPVKVIASEHDCSFRLGRIGQSSCDIAKGYLAARAIPYENEAAAPGTIASVKIGARAVIPSFDGRALAAANLNMQSAAFDEAMRVAIAAAGYPAPGDPRKVDRPMVVFLLFLLALCVTMVYGPMAAWLVELFPARMRYTSTWVPYHIGNGWFGGFLPPIAFAMVAATGDIYYGLRYPIVVAVATAVIGTLFMPETKQRDVHPDA
jgi:MFS family permease